MFNYVAFIVAPYKIVQMLDKLYNTFSIDTQLGQIEMRTWNFSINLLYLNFKNAKAMVYDTNTHTHTPHK